MAICVGLTRTQLSQEKKIGKNLSLTDFEQRFQYSPKRAVCQREVQHHYRQEVSSQTWYHFAGNLEALLASRI
jgi:hypothetical protein